MEPPPQVQQQQFAPQPQQQQQQPQRLMLAVHTVATATAKVPFAMILLLDYAKRRATPPGCRCRMVLPSDGNSSFSLWDLCTEAESLEAWLNENLGGDCITQLHEVQEDFTYGLSLDLARMRATDKVTDGSLKTIGALGEHTSKAVGVLAAGVTTAVGSTQQRLEAFDQRTQVITTAKEATSAIAERAIGALSKAAEDSRVQSVASGVAGGWSKLSSWVNQQIQDVRGTDHDDVYGSAGGGSAAAAGHQQQQPEQQHYSPSAYAPPPPSEPLQQPSAYSPGGSGGAPAAATGAAAVGGAHLGSTAAPTGAPPPASS